MYIYIYTDNRRNIGSSTVFLSSSPWKCQWILSPHHYYILLGESIHRYFLRLSETKTVLPHTVFLQSAAKEPAALFK